MTGHMQQQVGDRRPSVVDLFDPPLCRDHAPYRVVELGANALQIIFDPGMHVHEVTVVLKCGLPGRELRWRNNSRRQIPHPKGRRVQNHPLALPVSAVWRHAHQLTRPELVGEVVSRTGRMVLVDGCRETV